MTESIYSLPGCDAIFIGPVDLRAQMRDVHGDDPTDEEHEAMVQRVFAMGTPSWNANWNPHHERRRCTPPRKKTARSLSLLEAT